MKRQWTTEELVEQWTIQAEDLAWLANKTGATRLGFAVLLKYFQHEGRFPQSRHEVPGAVVTYLATQLGLAPDIYLQYDWQWRSIKDHRAQVEVAPGCVPSSLIVYVCSRMLAGSEGHPLPKSKHKRFFVWPFH